MFKDLFISYGRRESLGFVARLHQKIKLAGYEAWFDKVNIPDGEDYAARISHGIESAHNFVYVMAARALSSPYCLIEIEYARVLGKRVIPINQAVTFQVTDVPLSETDQQVLQQFYCLHGIVDPQIKTTQQVLERSLALVGRTDWLDAKENISNQDCEALANWARAYENQWHKHESQEYLQSLELPQFGEAIDSLDSVIERLVLVLERHKYYVSQHTLLTTQALAWACNQSLNHYLLVGKERQAAEEWLLVKFQEGEQAPCAPCDLLCDFLCESRKNAENRMTDCFICYDYADKATRNLVVKALARHAITTWRHDNDIQHSSKSEQAILAGIAGADNVLYFISPAALVSEACKQELAYAREFNKRIIPLLIKVTPNLPAELQQLQYINFIEDQQHGFAELLRVLHIDNHYYEQHKMLLARALEWQAGAAKTSFLLRGYNLENAKTWLRLNQQREQHPPTDLHLEFITASEAAKDRLGTEVFLSYSRKDGDFARQLNRVLQESGKTVWFDQESISSGANFELELYKGIQNSDNFLFVISPDSVTSPYCENEVNYAAQQGKRLVSVLCRETEPSSLPEILKSINWIDFAQQDFDKQFPELIQTLELDREHAHQHTVLQQRANEWQDNQESNDFLLNFSACDKAEAWLSQSQDKKPVVTALQKNYIDASRIAIKTAQRKAKLRQHLTALGMFLAIGLAIFAWHKSEQADENAQQAQLQKTEAQRNQSFSLTGLAQSEIDKGNPINGLLLALEGLPKNFSEPDRPYVPILQEKLYAGMMARREYAVLKQDDAIQDASFSPNGSLVATHDGNHIKLWDSTTGKMLGALQQYLVQLTALNFSQNGQWLAATDNNQEVLLWSIACLQQSNFNCEPIAKLQGNSFVFDPNSHWLAIVNEMNAIQFWRLESNHAPLLKQSITTDSTQIHNLVFSPDSQLIATVEPQLIRLWAVKNGTELASLKHDDSDNYNKAEKLLFNSKATRLVTNENLHVTLWDISNCRTGQKNCTQLVSDIDTKNYSTFDIKFSPDGEVLALASWDMKVWLLNSKDGKLIRSLSGHQDGLYHLDFNSNGQMLATVSRDKTVRLWDIATGKETAILRGHTGDVRYVSFNTDSSRLLSLSDDGTAILWYVTPPANPLTFKQQTTTKQPTAFYDVNFSPDGRLVAIAAQDNLTRLWDITRNKLHMILEGHQAAVGSVTFSRDGRKLATASSDNTVRVWNLADCQTEKNIESICTSWSALLQHPQLVSDSAFSPDGKYLATSSNDGMIRLWNLEQPKQPLLEFIGDTYEYSKVSFNSKGTLLVSTDVHNNLNVWDVKTGKVVAQERFEDVIGNVTFCANDQRLAVAVNDKTAWIVTMDCKTVGDSACKLSRSIILPDNESGVSGIACSTDGKKVLTSSDNNARLWDISAAVDHLASTNTLNEPLEATLIAIFRGHTARVRSTGFNPDSTLAATASEDGSVRLWHIYPDITHLVDEVRRILPRQSLSKRQRHEFYLSP